MGPNSIDPGHNESRAWLRTLGPILIVIGIVLSGFGILLSFTNIAPIMFLLVFVGMPVGFAGLVMTLFGYIGAISRYQAQEIAPVGKDTFNYVAEGTREGVENIAHAIGRGLSAGGDPFVVSGEKCPACGKANREDAKFCDQCGAALAKICPSCGKQNEAHSQFCSGCGSALS